MKCTKKKDLETIKSKIWQYSRLNACRTDGAFCKQLFSSDTYSI